MYKTSIETMPFNMVFGLDAVLPMEFFIPTLCVAKELNWTSHELSERLEDLEKLNETFLGVVHGRYALMQRKRSSMVVT